MSRWPGRSSCTDLQVWSSQGVGPRFCSRPWDRVLLETKGGLRRARHPPHTGQLQTGRGPIGSNGRRLFIVARPHDVQGIEQPVRRRARSALRRR
jgi:hypothetical protein